MTTTLIRPAPVPTHLDRDVYRVIEAPRGDHTSTSRPPARGVGARLSKVAVGTVSITLGSLYIATYVVVGVVRTSAHLLSSAHTPGGRCPTCRPAPE